MIMGETMKLLEAGDQGVAVRRRGQRRQRGDGGAAAGPVLDHDGRFPFRRDDIGQRPRDQVGAAARRERHQDADRMCRVGIGGIGRQARCGGKAGQCAYLRQQAPHGFPRVFLAGPPSGIGRIMPEIGARGKAGQAIRRHGRGRILQASKGCQKRL